MIEKFWMWLRSVMGSGIGQRKRMKNGTFHWKVPFRSQTTAKWLGLYRFRHFSEILSYPRQVRAQLADGFLPVQQHRHPVAVGIAPFRTFIHVPPPMLGVLWPAMNNTAANRRGGSRCGSRKPACRSTISL